MNQEQSEKCLDLAFSFYNKGNYEKAKQLFEKSYRLHQSKKAQDFVGLCQEKIAKDQQKQAQYQKQQQEEDKSPEVSFTQDQVDIANKINKLKDFYQILGISKTATDAEIKKAYKKLAVQLHPDKNKAPVARDAFKKIAQAYDCLTNPERRATYNRYGNQDIPSTNHQSYYYSDVSADNIFNQFFANGQGFRGAQFNNGQFYQFGFGEFPGFKQSRNQQQQQQQSYQSRQQQSHQSHQQQQQQQQQSSNQSRQQQQESKSKDQQHTFEQEKRKQEYMKHLEDLMRNQNQNQNKNSKIIKIGPIFTILSVVIILVLYIIACQKKNVMPISYSYNYKYNELKMTQTLGIKYYVDKSFGNSFGKSPSMLKLIENEIESAHYDKIYQECENSKILMQQLINKGNLYKNQKYEEEANEIDLTICQVAENIRKEIKYIRYKQYIK